MALSNAGAQLRVGLVRARRRPAACGRALGEQLDVGEVGRLAEADRGCSMTCRLEALLARGDPVAARAAGPTWVNSPFLLVLVSILRVTPPWNSIRTTASSSGWPLSSTTLPRAVPGLRAGLAAERGRRPREPRPPPRRASSHSSSTREADALPQTSPVSRHDGSRPLAAGGRGAGPRTPASANPRSRSRHDSQTPQAASSAW